MQKWRFQGSLNWFLKIYCFGLIYACFAQLALQKLGADGSVWGYCPGWQREIGFWNIGLIVILIQVILWGDLTVKMYIARALVLLSLLFGTNHLVAVLETGNYKLYAHMGGAIENYFAVCWGGFLVIVFQLTKGQRAARKTTGL
jgi:KinB signaling pathway activation protein